MCDVDIHNRRFILHSRQYHGDLPLRNAEGEIITYGAIGRIGIGNCYLQAYAKWPDERRPEVLKVGECIQDVEYRLSGERGVYDIYRVR